MAIKARHADQDFMTVALSLARRGLGCVWPNPAVGCVIVKDDEIVGRGWTQPGGRPHAETEALRRAGSEARGAVAYVSLEPCAHHGETPPCAEALVDAGIKRVVVGLIDPDPRVAGQGIEILKKAKVVVDVGVCEDIAAEINAGFVSRIEKSRPHVTLKLASTLDGKIATKTGESRWISGEDARRKTHLLRAQNDAILVGAGTVEKDDPSLTCRLPGLPALSPVKVVLDGKAASPAKSKVFKDGETWLIVAEDHIKRATKSVGRKKGVTVLSLTAEDNIILIEDVLSLLAERGITRLLVEGGGETAAAFLKAGLVDTLVWVHAPLLLGADGVPAVGGMDIAKLRDAPGFVQKEMEQYGADSLALYGRRR